MAVEWARVPSHNFYAVKRRKEKKNLKIQDISLYTFGDDQFLSVMIPFLIVELMVGGFL